MSSEQTQDGQRRRSPLLVASVAAAVLLAGGGGAYLATVSSDDGGRDAATDDGGAPPPLTLDAYTGDRDGRSSQGPDGSTEGIAPGEPDPNGATYRAVGELPDGPDSAAVRHVRDDVPRDRVTRLAKALGVSGTPVLRDSAWWIGPTNDGAGPSLRVSKAAPGTWTYTRHATPGGDNCLKGKRCPGTGTGPDAGTGTGAAERRPADDSGGAVSEAAAKKAATPVLKAVGLDDAKLDARQLMGAVRVVNADPEVGGLPTYGWSTGVQVGADGQVVGGSGHLTEPEQGATYPVVGAGKTLDLLNKSGRGDGRGGIGGCARPVPHGDEGKAPQGRGADGVAPGEPAPGKVAPGKVAPGEPAPGKNVPCPPASKPPTPQPIAVEDAEFGLAAQFVDGRTALVPSWLFQVKPAGAPEAYTVTHPAVDPKYLRAPGESGTVGPSQGPTVRPGDPDTRTEDVKVEGYSTAGRTLTLHFTDGVCSTFAASADERDGQVAVKVTSTTKKGTVCVAMAQSYVLSVKLDAPLGDRKVVSEGGRAVPRDDGTREGTPAPRT
ncbi:hypothetical protein [Streptomyces flavofungini]|uniref:Large membrane protein n=1 Tax=Streptomyces flavofungini TaxID=68200 RepID=A0ABS0X2H3_9ACTN|nr:hypothetical protein [Streptomyces flavofungini]MBJ3807385.1 hypothetical protein [Streptomyces flavofungini]GHC65848.1 membrane protein [Streptomyces flavofungini]